MIFLYIFHSLILFFAINHSTLGILLAALVSILFIAFLFLHLFGSLFTLWIHSFMHSSLLYQFSVYSSIFLSFIAYVCSFILYYTSLLFFC